MAKTVPNALVAGQLEHYDRLLSTIPGIERKGATMPYTSLNGHMFSFIAYVGTLKPKATGRKR